MGREYRCKACDLDLVAADAPFFRLLLLHLTAGGELIERVYFCSYRCMATWLAGKLAEEEKARTG